MSLQPCSSSPISRRFGSLDSVVLPVPDRPKKSAVSPSSPMFAEQCIEQHALQRQRVVEDREDRLLDFAGVVRAADEHQLLAEVHEDEDLASACRACAGSALKFGASMTVNSGRCAARFAGSFSGRNMLRANRLCQANSFTTRIGSLYVGSVPRPRVEDEQILVLQIRHHVAGAARRTSPPRPAGSRCPSARAARSTAR